MKVIAKSLLLIGGIVSSTVVGVAIKRIAHHRRTFNFTKANMPI